MSYSHFTPMKRTQLEWMLRQGMKVPAIAGALGYDASSVRREIGRNSSNGVYTAEEAQQRYEQRRLACRPKGRLAHEALREAVIEQIAEHGLSPELTAGRLRSQFPHEPSMQVCHETIYNAIYANRHLLDFLLEFLVQARPKRRKHGQGKTRRGPLIPNRVSINERPVHIEKREEVGHWEGDLVVGKNQDGFIVTLVERSSRLLHAVKISTKKPHIVAKAVLETLMDRPRSWLKSLTLDNGTEFREHETMSKHLGLTVYFADPYSAYQRGSNEQVNGLLRRYLPKGTSFEDLTQQQLDAFVKRINNRPRKCLGYRTPTEVFQSQRKRQLQALRT